MCWSFCSNTHCSTEDFFVTTSATMTGNKLLETATGNCVTNIFKTSNTLFVTSLSLKEDFKKILTYRDSRAFSPASPGPSTTFSAAPTGDPPNDAQHRNSSSSNNNNNSLFPSSNSSRPSHRTSPRSSRHRSNSNSSSSRRRPPSPRRRQRPSSAPSPLSSRRSFGSR